MAKLRAQSSVPARALEFLILTVNSDRRGAGREMGRDQFRSAGLGHPGGADEGGRGAAGVPLSDRCVEILREAEGWRMRAGFVFSGERTGALMNNMALPKLLQKLSDGATVHGFRSSFRDWAGEETHFPREVAEGCLAHVVGNVVEQAYRRGDALDKRRALMAAWAKFCG